MKITGLITEYNPFHNGHLFHLNQSREKTDADYCVALMSGTFVQRGAPAVYDKYVRTAMALRAGVDLVLEMPAAFSTASAREFAFFGLSLFTSLGADSLCFGSECGEAAPLKAAAKILNREPEDFTSRLKEGLKAGQTFPQARSSALAALLSGGGTQAGPDHILTEPNNILAIEYFRAAAALHSPLKLETIRREGRGYHDTAAEGPYPSASAIRQALSEKRGIAFLKSMVPASTAALMENETPLFSDDFGELLNYRIWMGDFRGISDFTPELASRLENQSLRPCAFEERIQTLKSRQLTYTRVSRALLHLLLNMKADDTEAFKEAGYATYARVLGFRKDALPLLTELKKRTAVPVVTKLADASRNLSPIAMRMLEQEVGAAHLYQIVKQKKGCALKNEYTQPILII